MANTCFLRISKKYVKRNPSQNTPTHFNPVIKPECSYGAENVVFNRNKDI